MKYDLLQNRDNDENGTNGVWDLAYELTYKYLVDKLGNEHLVGTVLFEELWEEIYNDLQNFKELLIEQISEVI